MIQIGIKIDTNTPLRDIRDFVEATKHLNGSTKVVQQGGGVLETWVQLAVKTNLNAVKGQPIGVAVSSDSGRVFTVKAYREALSKRRGIDRT